MSNAVRLSTAILMTAVTLSTPALSQVGTATLSGTVADSTGAAIGGADVALEGTQAQFSRATVSGDAGQYVIPAIPPGFYRLVVRKAGFNDETVNEFQLSTGQSSTLNVTLGVAATQTKMTVTEAPPLLQTTDATVGTVIERKQITELPLLGRNFTSLLLVMPGVSTAPVPRGGPFSIGGTGINPNVFGQRWRNNNYTLDGVSNNEPLFNGIPMLPPPEALAEMKMESAMSSGAYGHASGANINLVTKSGTNEWHGGAWEFLRNNKLDARGFFLPQLGPFRWNQFGAAIGGPLSIPKLVSKDRAWYVFGYYEGIRLRGAANTSALLPTPEQLAGDFTGAPTIYNPYTTTTDATGRSVRQPFPDNRIPASLINPAAKTIATSLYPAPNLAAGVIPGINFFNPGSSRQNGDQWSGRVDHQFGAKDYFYARYTDANNPSKTVGMPTLPGEAYNRFTNVVASNTHTFSPTFLITGRFGMQRLNYGNFVGGDLGVARRAGTLDAFPAFRDTEVIPPISITGFAGLSQGLGYYGPQYDLSWTGDGSKTAGKHTIQFGGGITRTTFVTNNQTGTQVQFTTLQTSNFVPNTGFALASFVLGTPESAGRVIGSTEGDMYGNAYSAYVQDNWRVNSRLTVNLGLRWDYAAPMINRKGSGTFIYETGKYVWDITNPITNEPANIRHGVIEPDRNNFQPRIGIAYQVNPRTVVRSSYGIFYDTFGINYAQTQQGNRGNWPFAFPQSVSGLNSGVPTLFLQNPFPSAASGSRTPLGCQQCLNAWTGTSRTPYVQQWTLSVQRQLTSTLKAEAIYFGSHGVKISSQLIDNTAIVPGPGPIAPRQIWPQFPAYVNNGYNGSQSWYQGLSLSLERRFARGLSFSVNYTRSKTMNYVDELSDNMQGPGALPTRNTMAFWKALAGWDTPNRLVMNYIYELPFKTASKAANAAIAGWAVSGILSLDAGLPYSVRQSADVANIGTVSGRPVLFANLVGDPSLPNPTPQRWFNTAAFAVPASYTYGNAGRNIMRSDGLSTFNLTTYKVWRFMETRAFEFRAEFYNLANHTTFGYPGFTVDSPANFGRVSSTRNSGRTIQFGAKIRF